MRLLSLLAVAALVLTACAEEDKGIVCNAEGFSYAAESNNYSEQNALFIWEGQGSRTTPYDRVLLEIFGELTPGTRPLDGDSYNNCTLCFSADTQCTFENDCEQIFFARSGTLTIHEASTQDGAPFRATLSNVVLEAVTFDTTTLGTTPIPGGPVWCIPTIEIDTTVNVR